ncbi:MAG: GvpL/GvpF family gas vesicle protein, partial [Planctomycetota bacterium]
DELKAIGAELAEHGEQAPHQLKVAAGRRVERLLSERHLHIAGLFDASVAPVCQEATARDGAAETELFACTVLVRRDDESALDAALEELAGALNEDYLIGVKGPFAPHSFVDLNLSLGAAA